MTHRDSTQMKLLALAVGLTACAGPQQGPGERAGIDLDAARSEVLAAENAMNEAVDGLDCPTGMAYAADSEPLFFSSGNAVRTKAELADMCERMVEPRTGAVFSIDSRSARMLSDSAALVVREGTYTIKFRDGSSRVVYLIMSTVWERASEGWRMIHLHESGRPVD